MNAAQIIEVIANLNLPETANKELIAVGLGASQAYYQNGLLIVIL